MAKRQAPYRALICLPGGSLAPVFRRSNDRARLEEHQKKRKCHVDGGLSFWPLRRLTEGFGEPCFCGAIPSGDLIRHRHQDPEGHSVNGQIHVQAIRSPDGGRQGILKGALEATRGRIGTLRLGQECCALSGSIKHGHQES
ncbi:hypothetical protein ACLOJK_004372 [Asimina triloba]